MLDRALLILAGCALLEDLHLPGATFSARSTGGLSQRYDVDVTVD